MKILFIIVLTLISGLLTAYSYFNPFTLGVGAIGLYVFPGIIYGIFLSIYFFVTEKTSLKDGIKITSISTLAWFVAFVSGSFTLGIVLYISGMLGALIIAKGIQSVLPKLNPIYPIVIAGGVAAIPFKYLFFKTTIGGSTYTGLEKFYFTSLGFIVWQMVVGLAIAILIIYKNKAIPEASLNLDQNVSTPNKINSALDKYLIIFIGIVCLFMFAGLMYVAQLCSNGGGC